MREQKLTKFAASLIIGGPAECSPPYDMDALSEALRDAKHHAYAKGGKPRRLMHLAKLENLCRWWLNGGWPAGGRVDLRPVWRYLHRRQLPHILRPFSLRAGSGAKEAGMKWSTLSGTWVRTHPRRRSTSTDD